MDNARDNFTIRIGIDNDCVNKPAPLRSRWYPKDPILSQMQTRIIA